MWRWSGLSGNGRPSYQPAISGRGCATGGSGPYPYERMPGWMRTSSNWWWSW